MGFKTTYYNNGGKITKKGLQAATNPFIDPPENQLPTATVAAKAPEWLKHKRQFEKENPITEGERRKQIEMEYRRLSTSREGMRRNSTKGNQRLPEEELRTRSNQNVAENRNQAYRDYAAERLVRDNPKTSDKSPLDTRSDRVRQMERFSDQDLAIINNSSSAHKIKPSTWQSFEQGLLSLSNALSPVEINSDQITEKEMEQYGVLNALDPLSIPGKMIQSISRDDYSMTDALQGKSSDAGFAEQMITDPLNWTGMGIASKLGSLGKLSKVAKLGKAAKAAKVESAASTATSAATSPGIKLYHTGEGLSMETLSVAPRVTRQGKKGKYGGLYTYDNLEDVRKFQKGNKTKGTYEVELKPSVKIKEYKGQIERLDESTLSRLREEGYQVIRGKSIMGKEEIIVIDKNAVANIKDI